MSNDVKTVLDVITDIRKRAEHAHDSFINDPDDTVSHNDVSEMLLEIASSLETAFNNECDECEIEASERKLRNERLEASCHWYKQYLKKGEVKAETARQNVRLREALTQVSLITECGGEETIERVHKIASDALGGCKRESTTIASTHKDEEK